MQIRLPEIPSAARVARMLIPSFACLLVAVAAARAQTPSTPSPREILAGATAAWHMGGEAELKSIGNVQTGVALSGADRNASLARSGDGVVGRFDGGHLDAGQGANNRLQIKGDQLTIFLRLRPTSEQLPDGELFCKHGGHETTSFNLYTNNGNLGFEIGTREVPRLAANIRVSGEESLRAGQWIDVIARYDGSRVVLFINGRLAASAPIKGELRQNTEPLLIGRCMRGEIDHAALWSRALSDAEVLALSGGTTTSSTAGMADRAIGAKTEAITGKDGLTTADQLRAARDLRAKIAADPHHPRYHLRPPDGFWNDINGTLYWKGRYHVFFLGRQAPDAATVLSGTDTSHPRENWLHASSADLVHWIHHPTAIEPVFDGSMPKGVYSGDAVDGALVPTLIYHVPGQGTCIATASDPSDAELVKWIPNEANPVIPDKKQPKEVSVFDPTAWREADGTYYALIGNRNGTPGYEGDGSSLYRSNDLIHWEYRGPLYKSDRKWTAAYEDAACPDFFPIGNGRHMLLMHCHSPFNGSHYYIGKWDRAAERFIPENHGRMSWAAGSVCAPETLLDDKGRRVFWGWVQEPYRTSDAWASVATLPRILSLAPDNTLRIQPAPELETLRHNERTLPALTVSGERELDGIQGDALEIRAKIRPGKTGRFGIVVRRSPDGAEQTPVWIDLEKRTLAVDISRSTLDPSARWLRWTKGRGGAPEKPDEVPEKERYVTGQTAPFDLAADELVDLRVFIDRSIVEVFVNDRQCLTQRIYPSRADSLGVALIAEGEPVSVEQLQVWDMHPTQ